MKRYLLFSGSQYYPRGGADDFVGSFDTISRAEIAGDARLANTRQAWASIAKWDGSVLRTVLQRDSYVQWYDPRDDD